MGMGKIIWFFHPLKYWQSFTFTEQLQNRDGVAYLVIEADLERVRQLQGIHLMETINNGNRQRTGGRKCMRSCRVGRLRHAQEI